MSLHVARSGQVNDETAHNIPEESRADASELQKFARCFTSDWRLHSDSFIGIAYAYIQQLPPDRKAVLEREFRAFLYGSGADSDEALLQLWYAQGAQAWDLDLTVRPVMSDFLWLMNPEALELELPTVKPIGGTGHVAIGLKPRRQRE
jgi:hypothetical protein